MNTLPWKTSSVEAACVSDQKKVCETEEKVLLAEKGLLQKKWLQHKNQHNKNLEDMLSGKSSVILEKKNQTIESISKWGGYRGSRDPSAKVETAANICEIADTLCALSRLSYRESLSKVCAWVDQEASLSEIGEYMKSLIHLREDALFVFTDIETTGSNPEEHEIIEVAVVVTDSQGNEIERFEKMFGVDNPIIHETHIVPWENTHNIFYDDIKNLPSFASDKKFRARLSDVFNDPRAIVVAHNKSFENSWYSMYVDGYFKHHHRIFGGEGRVCELDTMVLNILMFSTDRNRLLEFVENNGYEYVDAHRAMKDTEMMMKALFSFINKSRRLSV